MTSNHERTEAIEEPENKHRIQKIQKHHPARLGVGRAGSRPQTDSLLRFRLDHAKARDAVTTHVGAEVLADLGVLHIQSCAEDKTEFLANPDRGRDLSAETISRVQQECVNEPQIQIVISDGLSSTAVEANIPDLLPVLIDGLADRDMDVGTPIFVEYGRVDVMDAIGQELNAECCVNLIGERPGLATNESLSAYFAYNPERGMETSKKSVISNIHREGIPPVEAGAEIAAVMDEMCEKQQSGLDIGNQ